MKVNIKNIFSKKIIKNYTDDELKAEIQELESIDYSKLDDHDLSYSHYGYVQTFKVIADGLRFSTLKQFSAGMLAGFWIGAAYTAVLYASYKLGNPSLEKLMTGLLFSGVILLISFLGGGFVTAHMWINRSMFKGVERWRNYAKACGLVYIGNIVGIGIFVSILLLANAFNAEQFEYLYDHFSRDKLGWIGTAIQNGGIGSLTTGKTFQTIGYIFASAILCNFLICLATQGAKSTKGNTVATMIMYLLVLFFFAIGGYQHCVANWYGVWVGILAPLTNTGSEVVINNDMGWALIVFNIIPVFIGNWVGAYIMGAIMSWYNKEYEVLLVKQYRIRTLTEELASRTKK
ncbi:formate/nitrite transporter family protein [Mesoplasma photuris]|uniref:formate/nitrite transporter family protein n=1 Tax=Mesoplasma photuris TaxID=217731 RepID=UPI0004E2056E|nr:formate/nitrite transporter family protein [Mesoplasma photuris]